MPRLARLCRHSCPMRRWSGHDATSKAKAAAGVYLGIALWGGLWLRDARVRNLLPLSRVRDVEA
jgi:hypothetical protein